MIKKIGIISELTNDTLNYGNRLQVYALNKYINKLGLNVSSLILNFESRMFLNKSVIWLVKKLLSKVRECLNRKITEKNPSFFIERLKKCRSFTDKIQIESFDSLKNFQLCNYDGIIVGSDVVWQQRESSVDKLRFLNFKLLTNYKKISYAASFGKNWIPQHNKRYIKKCLDDFEAISVREKSSIALLESIGVKNAVHVCDPTLLLTAEEWGYVAEPVKEINEKYIFVYLLGKDVSQREAIKKLAEKYNLKIATIPHADNVYDPVDDDFGDYKLMDASPENWVWLIKNSEYVITDSFHGTVFSTIFSKNFLVTKRHWEQDINMRMTDFLDTIDEQDKFVDILLVDSLEDFVWDYEKIHNITDEFIEKSKDYLEKALN